MMLRLTLAQMRRSTARLAAAGLAIVVGTAFVAATLLAGSLIKDTTYRTVTASLADADVVVHRTDETPLTPDDVTAIGRLDAVEAADGVAQLYGQVRAGGRQDAAVLTPAASTPRLDPFTLVEGRSPAPGEVALTESGAERLHVTVGEVVRVEVDRFTPDPGTADGSGTWSSEGTDLTLSGVLADPPAISGSASAVVVSRATLEGWLRAQNPGTVTTSYDSVLVAAADGATPAAAAQAVASVVPGGVVRTALEQAELKTQELTGDTQTLTYLVLGFAAVAMVVAGLVIANTFQVLVAQRTRSLALLRCVGATKAQVHGSVLLEALVLGVIASVVGLVAGLALGQGALWVLGRADLGLDLTPMITLTPAVVVVPVLTGAGVTVLAALAPARAATRVRPLAALRPADVPTVRRGGRERLWSAVALTGAGAALLVGAATIHLVPAADEITTMGLALAVGIVGGLVSFTGVMVGAVFLVPGAVGLLGRALVALARPTGRPTVRLAAVNATRNPRRTSATAAALLIGVTLVTMMATGAAGARSSLGATLDAQFPVDLAVVSMDTAGAGAAPLSAAQAEAVRSTAGVERAVDVPVLPARLVAEAGGTEAFSDLTVLSPRDATALARDEETFAGLADGVILLGGDLAESLAVDDGDRVAVSAVAGTGPGAGAGTGTAADLVARVVPGNGWLAVATPAALAQVRPEAPVTSVWARVGAEDAGATVLAVQDAVAAATTGADTVPHVVGAVAEREQYEEIIDTLLAIVVGLLGVAVVIALIGVANTLSLSVIERRREHALLRATGLTRGQLRGMLATEGVLIALVGALLGSVLGLVYGWAGTAVILGGTGEVVMAVPWTYLGAIAAVALAAGLLASVLPARSAVRTPPVAALAAE